jgi:hypothetical protein
MASNDAWTRTDEEIKGGSVMRLTRGIHGFSETILNKAKKKKPVDRRLVAILRLIFFLKILMLFFLKND